VDIMLIPANEYRRERWKNGLGWTREIVRWPAGAADWDWRLSIAEVDKDGPFSPFPDVERELVLLHGEGVRLHFDDGQTVALLPPHDRHRFAGERALRAELIAGPTQDFNLMWRRGRVEATLLHRPLVGPMLFFAEAGVRWAIHVLSGRALFKDQRQPMVLEQGDTALIAPGVGGANRVILEGGGELLLVRIGQCQEPGGAQANVADAQA
jgi:environmental stress-induced protein Ves